MVILTERILRLSERYKGALECRKRRGKEKKTLLREEENCNTYLPLQRNNSDNNPFNWFNPRGQIKMISTPQITATFFNLAQLRLSVVFKKMIIKYSSGSIRGEMEAICKSQKKSKFLLYRLYSFTVNWFSRKSKHVLNLHLYFGFFHCESHQKLNRAQRNNHMRCYWMDYSYFSWAFIKVKYIRLLPTFRHMTNNPNNAISTYWKLLNLKKCVSCHFQCFDSRQGQDSMEEDGSNVVQQQHEKDTPVVGLQERHHSTLSSSAKLICKVPVSQDSEGWPE